MYSPTIPILIKIRLPKNQIDNIIDGQPDNVGCPKYEIKTYNVDFVFVIDGEVGEPVSSIKVKHNSTVPLSAFPKIDTKMYKLINKDEYNVNSIHSMIAPKENVEGYAKISSISYDGLVESFELENKKFVLGIKWHPELMLEDNFTQNLFNEFIKNCK